MARGPNRFSPDGDHGGGLLGGGCMNPLRSVFVELLGWADNAGPLPLSFAVVGILLGMVLLVVGVALAAVAGRVVLGAVVVLVSVGLLFGTVASRPS